MALLLHYTGQDYISRGLLNTELTPGSTSAIVGGCKTGKGFVFDGTVNSGLISLTTINDNTLTMSAWIRLTAQGVSGSRYTIFGTSNGGRDQILFDVYDVNRLRLVILYSDNTADICDSIINNSIQINTWYHVVATINKTTRLSQLFINGILVNSLVYSNKQIQTTDRFFVGRRLADAAFNGQICNLKVYNHVLSAREIAEDYKSLMLHYKLDNPYEVLPYVALRKDNPSVPLSGMIKTPFSDYDKFTFSKGGTSTISYPNVYKTYNSYVNGKTYTLTVTYRVNSIVNIASVDLRHSRWASDYQIGRSNVFANPNDTKWKTVTLTQTMNESDPNKPSNQTLAPQFVLMVNAPGNNLPSSIDIDIKDVYATEGTSIQPYVLPEESKNRITDYSGFNRHITNLTTNTVTLDSKSQVYSASLKNNGTQSIVGTSDLTDLNGLPEISISFRVYKTTSTVNAILANRTVTSNGIAIFISETSILVDLSVRNEHNYTLPLNNWVNICITQSTTEQKLYANGVLVSTMTAKTLSGINNYTSISNSNVIGGTIDYSLNGNVQDIRFYAKALTQADVTELYQTRHLVDKDSNCYTYELIEGRTKVGMNKQGQLLCDEVIENEDGTFQIVSNKTIKTKEFKEI